MEFPKINEDDDFHEFRSKGLGSSDMAPILDISPYKTRHRLWMEKTGLVEPENIPSYVMQRGIDLEPIVRNWFNKEYGYNCVVERRIDTEYDYLRANADGVDVDNATMIEIKCGGLDDHVAAFEHSKVPDKYYPQLIFLSYVFKLPIWYVSYNESFKESPFVAFLVPPDTGFTEKMLEAAHDFWKHVCDKTPFPLSSKDDAINDDESVEDLVKIYEEIKERLDDDTKELKSIQKLISEKVNHTRTLCGGYRLTWVEKKGNIDYAKVPFDGDIESFRKKSTKYFTIRKVSK